MSSKNILYEGTNKRLYQDDESLIQFFKDDFKLANNTIIQIAGKGTLNNQISSFIMENMQIAGIANHFLERLNMREQRIQILDILPVEVYISNLAVGRYVTQLGIEEGYVFDTPITDFRVKHKEHYGSVMNEQQLIEFGWLGTESLKHIKQEAQRANAFLTGMFAAVGLRLAECRLEFGCIQDDEFYHFIIADEITQDTCRLWDISTNQRMDFEYINSHPEKGLEVYSTLAEKLNIM